MVCSEIMPKTAGLLLVLAFGLSAAPAREPQNDARLKKSFRRPDQNGWIFVHLEGSPSEIGFQHGYLLAPEIQDLEKVYQLELAHDTGKNWKFLREAGKTVLWPHFETE